MTITAQYKLYLPSADGKFPDTLDRPLLTYAKLEGLIALSGLGLVFLFPILTPLMASLLGDLLAYPAALNAARVVTAFILLLLPATAMGATLPLLVRTLTERGVHFGPAR